MQDRRGVEHSKTDAKKIHAAVAVCHPEQTSLCHQIAHAAAQELRRALAGADSESGDTDNGQCELFDLYALDFPAILTSDELRRKWPFDEQTQRAIAALQRSNLITCVHPNWWGAPPAQMVGWIQRTWLPNVAFHYAGLDYQKKNLRGLFTDKTLVVLVTTDSAPETPACRALQLFWENLAQTSECRNFEIKIFPHVNTSTLHERKKWLAETGQICTRYLQ